MNIKVELYLKCLKKNSQILKKVGSDYFYCQDIWSRCINRETLTFFWRLILNSVNFSSVDKIPGKLRLGEIGLDVYNNTSSAESEFHFNECTKPWSNNTTTVQWLVKTTKVKTLLCFLFLFKITGRVILFKMLWEKHKWSI